MASSGDRRKRKRVAVHWPLRLFRQPGNPLVESTTENLSSEGLYCITGEPFRPGERLQCEIVIPGERLGFSEPSMRLQCHVMVKRVEHLRGGFGLGCHIEDYSLATGSPPPAM
ncbi:MAG: PilZ domain-containing protein [Acidobacteriia bacterium]|nr:PilZ domain-containing protein [Terriglobia bacterium]